jgi:hypothetical protein
VSNETQITKNLFEDCSRGTAKPSSVVNDWRETVCENMASISLREDSEPFMDLGEQFRKQDHHVVKRRGQLRDRTKAEQHDERKFRFNGCKVKPSKLPKDRSQIVHFKTIEAHRQRMSEIGSIKKHDVKELQKMDIVPTYHKRTRGPCAAKTVLLNLISHWKRTGDLPTYCQLKRDQLLDTSIYVKDEGAIRWYLEPTIIRFADRVQRCVIEAELIKSNSDLLNPGPQDCPFYEQRLDTKWCSNVPGSTRKVCPRCGDNLVASKRGWVHEVINKVPKWTVSNKRSLRGHVLTDSDHGRIIAELLGLPVVALSVADIRIKTTYSVINYCGDNRLVTSRNIKIVEQAYDLVTVTASVPKNILQKGNAFFGGILLSAASYKMFSDVDLRGLGILTGVSLTLCAWLYDGRYSISFSYAPHLVSCVLQELPRKTTPESVVSTIASKLLRISCFPADDSRAVAIKQGTELAVLCSLDSLDFIRGRAGTFRASL